MTKTNVRRVLSAVSLVVLMAVMALSMISCDKKDDVTVTGTDVTITVQVTDDKGETTPYTVTTTETTLRGALEQENMVEGDESEYGLYIKKVCGFTADYDVDGSYWALYKNGEYLMNSADDEILEDGAVYEIKYTK